MFIYFWDGFLVHHLLLGEVVFVFNELVFDPEVEPEEVLAEEREIPE